jgi:ATP-dependent helicase YprA (DUF1998 family)
MAFIMRRLRRLCAALGNNQVQFISCSATIVNPLHQFRTIFGTEDVEVVDVDGSPTGNMSPSPPPSWECSTDIGTCRAQRIFVLEHTI